MASRAEPRVASASSAAARRPATSASSASVAAAASRAAATATSASRSATTAARTSSWASVQRASRVWRSSRSCNSAASAWRFSGRSRVRASRSTSSARSRLSCVRSSLSWARRRRLRCLPRPAASSISSRRSRGLEVTIPSTRPCETTECISLPSPVSESTSSTSTSRHLAPLRRYSPSPLRSSRRTIEISPTGRSIPPSALSRTSSTSAADRACTPRPPPKITSCMDCPRTASGDCSPIAHRTASVTFDLPDPLGPTITDTPGPNSRRVRSGKDLNPLRLSERRCIGLLLLVLVFVVVLVRVVEHLERGPRRLLLGVLLRAPRAGADRPARDRGQHLECAVVRRTELGRDRVLDLLAALREALLQRGLEVDRVLERVVDLRLERLDDRGGRALVPGVQIAAADHRLDHRGQHALRGGERRRALPHARGRRRDQAVRDTEALGHRPARR